MGLGFLITECRLVDADPAIGPIRPSDYASGVRLLAFVFTQRRGQVIDENLERIQQLIPKRSVSYSTMRTSSAWCICSRFVHRIFGCMDVTQSRTSPTKA